MRRTRAPRHQWCRWWRLTATGRGSFLFLHTPCSSNQIDTATLGVQKKTRRTTQQPMVSVEGHTATAVGGVGRHH